VTREYEKAAEHIIAIAKLAKKKAEKCISDRRIRNA